MALDFPTSPTDGQKYVTPVATFTWCASVGIWTTELTSGSTISAATGAEAKAGNIDTAYSSPSTALPKDSSGMTGAAIFPSGTTAERPATLQTGMTRFNTQTGSVEVYQGAATSWQAPGLLDPDVGCCALACQTTGVRNTALGQCALYSLTTGCDSSALGALTQALPGAPSGVKGATFVGFCAQAPNCGDCVTSVGAITYTSYSTSHIVLGFCSRGNSATANITDSNNIVLGFCSQPAGRCFTIAIGTCAGTCLPVASSCASTCNIAIGYLSGSNMLNRNCYNINIGHAATGIQATTSQPDANRNIVIENKIGATTCTKNTGLIRYTSIFSYDYVVPQDTTDTIAIGADSSVTNANVKVTWTVTSDARDKTEIAPIDKGLEFVKQLKPVSFRYKESRDSDEGHGDTRYGFLAQDILALEGDNPIIIDDKDPDHLKYRGESLVPVITKALQEVSARVSKMENQVAELKALG